MRRRQARISASVISATAAVLAPGMLHTAMPRARAAATSIASMPTPIFWISFRRGATSIIAAVTGSSTWSSMSLSASAVVSAASSPGSATAISTPSGNAPIMRRRFGPAR